MDLSDQCASEYLPDCTTGMVTFRIEPDVGGKKKKFIVAPPERKENDVIAEIVELSCFTFFYAANQIAINFELLCDAASLLEQELGKEGSKWS